MLKTGGYMAKRKTDDDNIKLNNADGQTVVIVLGDEEDCYV